MQRPNLVTSIYSYRSRVEDSDDDEEWPELSAGNQMRHWKCKNNRSLHTALPATSVGNNERTLDVTEYPLLGEPSCSYKELMTQEKFCSYSARTELFATGNRFDTELKRCTPGRRFRRPNRICINLRDVLQTAKCMKQTNEKGGVMVNMNFPGDESSGLTQTININTNANIRRVNIRISIRKQSKLRRVICIYRDMRNRMHMCKTLDAIGCDVNKLNLQSLKIIADPERDVDYIRGMSALTFYGNNYRNPIEAVISESSMPDCPDIVDKLNDLHIQKNQTSWRCRAIDSINPVKGNVIDNDIVQRTLSLGINDDDKRLILDCVIPDNQAPMTYSRNFREYCTNILTPGLNESLEKFLCEIVRLQRKHYDKDQNKAKYRRRYYSGLKEVRKHVQLRKVKFVIIAPDIEKIDLEGGLDEQVYKLIDACKQQNVVYCFGLRRRKLGYYTHGRGFVGSLGIANYHSTEKLFRKVLEDLVHARNEYKRLTKDSSPPLDLSKFNLDDCLLTETINILIRFLSPSLCKIERDTKS